MGTVSSWSGESSPLKVADPYKHTPDSCPHHNVITSLTVRDLWKGYVVSEYKIGMGGTALEKEEEGRRGEKFKAAGQGWEKEEKMKRTRKEAKLE